MVRCGNKGRHRQVTRPGWVIRVDLAVFALLSAIHNTGHYHVRPRAACLSSSCVRFAINRHSRRNSLRLDLGRSGEPDVPARPPKVCTTTATSLHRNCCMCRLIFVRSQFGKAPRANGGVPTADRARASEGKQIKGREVRRGRMAEERRHIKHFTRGAKKHDSPRIRPTH